MITQVGGPSSVVVAKDPRRKAQRIQFRRSTQIPYQSAHSKEFENQQKKALLTSVYIVLGSVLFTAGYFFFSGAKIAQK